MIRFTSQKLLRSILAFGLLSLVAAPAQAGDAISPKAEEKAKSLVESNQRMITVFAHPTSTFRDMKYSRTEKVEGGFKVIYEVNYTAFRGIGAKFYSNLAFTFDKDGYYKTVETAGRNCTVAPFTATDAALGVIQAVIKNEPELKENYAFLQIVEKSDARDMLKFVLMLSR